MAEFIKLSDVETVETVSDNANVLIEENGAIKKVSKDEIGGKKDAAASGVYAFVVDTRAMTHNCDFSKVIEAYNNGMPVMGIRVLDGSFTVGFLNSFDAGDDAAIFMFNNESVVLRPDGTVYWPD